MLGKIAEFRWLPRFSQFLCGKKKIIIDTNASFFVRLNINQIGLKRSGEFPMTRSTHFCWECLGSILLNIAIAQKTIVDSQNGILCFLIGLTIFRVSIAAEHSTWIIHEEGDNNLIGGYCLLKKKVTPYIYYIISPDTIGTLIELTRSFPIENAIRRKTERERGKKIISNTIQQCLSVLKSFIFNELIPCISYYASYK